MAMALVYIEPITDNKTNTGGAASPGGAGISRGPRKPAGLAAGLGAPTGGPGGQVGRRGATAKATKKKTSKEKKKEIDR